MQTCKIAGLILASILAIAPPTFGGGLDGIKLPDGRSNLDGNVVSTEVKDTHSGLSANFYAPSNQSHTRHWRIAPYWWGYPFGFAVFNKE
jgi:hypothetical protein